MKKTFNFLSLLIFLIFDIGKSIPLNSLHKDPNYLLKSLKTLPSCHQGILLVSQSPVDSSMDRSIPYKSFIDLDQPVSLMDIPTFLTTGLTGFGNSMPYCILIIIPLDNQTHEQYTIVQRLNTDFVNILPTTKRKPIVIFIHTWSLTLEIAERVELEFETLMAAFINTTFGLDSHIYNVFLYPYTSSISKSSPPYSIWEVYSLKAQLYVISHQLKSHLQYVELDFSDLINLYELLNASARRKDFRQTVITASVRERQKDWMHFETQGEKLILKDGFSVNLYWDLQTMLNFREAVVIGDGLVTLPNDSIGGKTVEQLNSGLADISLSHSLIVPFRAKHLTFLQPSYYGIQPSANSIRNIVTAPFKTSLWFILLATWVIIISTIKISTYARHCLHDRPIAHDSDVRFSKEIGMWAIAANCQKSSTSMKIIFLSGLICGLVSYVAYSAAIVSSLSVSIIPVEEFADLISFNFKFTVHKKSEPFQVFLQGMIESNNLHQNVIKISSEEEISHLMDPTEPKAFLTYPDLFYPTALGLNYSEKYICDHISNVQVGSVLYKSGMFLKKGSEYTEIFNHKLIMLKERGFNFRYFQTYERKNVLPCGVHTREPTKVNPVTFMDVLTTFLILFIGFVSSSFLLMLESMVNKYVVWKKKTKRQDK